MIKRRLAGLKARVIVTYLVIFLVSAAIMAGRAGVLFAAMATQTAEHDLELQTYLMASTLERPWSVLESESPFTIPQFQTLTGRFAQSAGGQLTLLDPRGEPLLFSADANLLATMADGTILVVKIGSTTFDNVTRAMQSLCENNVLGIVANGVRASELYSKYTYYYSKTE